MFNTIRGKKIAVLGFAFKKDTGDTRETPAIDVCRGLIADGANCAVYDPQVAEQQVGVGKGRGLGFGVEERGGSESSAPSAPQFFTLNPSLHPSAGFPGPGAGEVRLGPPADAPR